MLAPYLERHSPHQPPTPATHAKPTGSPRLPPLHWLHTVCPSPEVCSQMLIFCLKVLPPGLKLSAKLHELMLLKNGGRTGEPACFHVSSCTLHSSVQTAPPSFPTSLCRDQCPLGQSSPEALHCIWMYPFFLLPGPFLLSPSYRVSLWGQVQSLTNYLTLLIFPQV